MVGDALPAGFPPGTAGRAVLRLGPDELIVFQVADSSSPVFPAPTRLTVERVAVGASGASSETRGTAQPSSQPTALERLVDAIGHAATMGGTATPHRPWVDALPAVVRPRDLGGDDTAVGLLDDPAGQCRRPLGWQPDEGTLLLVGGVGSGTTTAASTVVAQCVRAADPDAMHLYVIDAQGATVWSAFEVSAHCAAVVRLAETERVSRLLARLAEVTDVTVAMDTMATKKMAKMCDIPSSDVTSVAPAMSVPMSATWRNKRPSIRYMPDAMTRS